MINPRPGGVPVYAQLAQDLRAQIVSGRLGPGDWLPSERTLHETYGLGRHTIRRAIGVLRAEGLVTVLKGLGVVVREPEEPQILEPPSGAIISTRMPTSLERESLGIDEGVPVLVVLGVGGGEEVFPGDRWRIRWP